MATDDNTPDPGDNVDDGQGDTTTNDGKGDPDALGDAGKKALQAERSARREAEAAAKAARDELAAAKEAGDGSKSEMERLADQVQALEKRAADAERSALVAEIASEKGLTPAQAKRLAGTTREDLEADADDLVEAFRPADDTGAKPAAGRPPKEKLRPGAAPDDGGAVDAEKVAESILSRPF